MKTTPAASDGARDFDFLMGRWKVYNRRLRERLRGSTEWDEFEATNVSRPLLDGLGNEDEYRTDHWPGFVGMAFRFFDPATKRWAIYWADSVRGVLEPPVFGGFDGGTGVFTGTDTLEGRPIRVRFIWSGVDTSTPRWEQAFSADDGKTWETNWTMDFVRTEGAVAPNAGAAPGPDFPVVELRRYTTVAGGRQQFARYFESYFPEAFEQLGAIAFGQFFERGNRNGFTWLRGFRDLDARAVVNGAFYYGPLWKAHRATMNGLLVDSDNVLLLRPLRPGGGVSVLPAVDPVRETSGAGGVVVAQILAGQPGRIDELARRAEKTFAACRAAGAREAGVLVTLDARNNFPQLPVREDGPYLVWLGILPDERALVERLLPRLKLGAAELAATDLLRGAPELVVLDPTPRSRLRWLAH
ncbi:MAG: NIPSNAP family protein [Acidobacteriota bacterium]